MKYFPEKQADVEVILKNEKLSKNIMRNGCTHYFKINNGGTHGKIRFIDCEELKFDEEVKAEIWFSLPEFFPFCLEVGQILPIEEASYVRGHATITKINNKLLDNKMENSIIPKHLQGRSKVLSVQKKTNEMKIKCTCGYFSFQIFKCIQPYRVIQKENKKSNECDDMFIKKNRTIIKIKCDNCSEEHVLFDSYKHGYYAISNKPFLTINEPTEFQQLTAKAIEVSVVLYYDISFESFHKKFDSLNFETYLSAFTEIRIYSAFLKKPEIYIEKTI